MVTQKAKVILVIKQSLRKIRIFISVFSAILSVKFYNLEFWVIFHSVFIIFARNEKWRQEIGHMWIVSSEASVWSNYGIGERWWDLHTERCTCMKERKKKKHEGRNYFVLFEDNQAELRWCKYLIKTLTCSTDFITPSSSQIEPNSIKYQNAYKIRLTKHT